MNSREERLVRLLADPVNRGVLAALEDAERAVTPAELAERIASNGVAIRPRSEGEAERRRILLSLHHNHLPRLDDAGVIDYDPDEGIVARGRREAIDAEPIEMGAIDELLSRYDTGGRTDEQTITVLGDREAVYEYGRRLADEAETELFLVYTAEELLDEACLPHARGAIERGVEFRAGAKSREVREFFREYLPEATVWEPQLDWANRHSGYPKISRLVFADRGKVVVGLWEESADGTRSEMAMVGEGANNPLVVLVRELLGPRLDHLDYQSDNFLGGLPFEP